MKRSIFLDTLPKVFRICFPDLPYKTNKTDYIVTLPNGSEIHLAGMDNGDAVEKILGTEFSTIYFNEASEMDYSPVQLVLSRLAERNKLKKRVFYDFNPPRKTHWSYWLFIKKLNPVDEEPVGQPELYGHLIMNPMDNLANIDEDYIALLESMPEKERERFLLGQFSDESDGQAYYAFDRENHVKEFNTPTMGTTVVALDFNVDPMTCVVIKPVNGMYYVFDEVYLRNSDTYQMTHELMKRKYSGLCIPDSTGKARKTSGKSDHEILKEAGFKIPSVRNPFVTDRVNNINRLFTSGKIVVHPRCKKLINDLEKVSWKDNKLDQKTDKSLTHISDALGYAMWHFDPIGVKTKPITVQSYR